MSRFAPRRVQESRAVEASPEQMVATGAFGGYGIDPIDGDTGYRLATAGRRETPYWTIEKSRAYSVAAYRANPMARAIIDTYVSFITGDSGLTLQCPNTKVRAIAEAFWNDPRTGLSHPPQQDLLLRDHMLMGESDYEMLVGAGTGVCRFSVIDPAQVYAVDLDRGNPLWFATLHIRNPGGEDVQKTVVAQDDFSALRVGEVLYWPSWRSLLTDRRGVPFLSPVIDWLDNYDTVLSNLIDRTALMRYIAMDVTVDGDEEAVRDFIRKRKGVHIPRSGTIEVHNKSVEWKPMQAETGSIEDTLTAKSTLTNIAAGSGLARTWLADPDDANRATSISMAEPVRRRVGSVQNMWLGNLTEMLRFVVDQAVLAHELPTSVPETDLGDGDEMAVKQVPPSATVKITGPEVAASDAEHAAAMLVNLSQALDGMVSGGILSQAAAKVAAKKAWEQFVGIPYTPELDRSDGSTADDIAGQVDMQQKPNAPALAIVGKPV